MARQFHPADELLAPAGLGRRLLAMLYDGLICIAVLIVCTWGYTMLAAWIIGFDEYKALAESGSLNSDPLLTSILFVLLFMFFGYFWTRTGQTLGMQVWRIRIENANGTSIRWPQALFRFLSGWALARPPHQYRTNNGAQHDGRCHRKNRIETKYHAEWSQQVLHVLEYQTNDDAGKHPEPHGD